MCPELTRDTIPKSRDVGHFLSVTGTVIRTSTIKVTDWKNNFFFFINLLQKKVSFGIQMRAGNSIFLVVQPKLSPYNSTSQNHAIALQMFGPYLMVDITVEFHGFTSSLVNFVTDEG